ncbi:MAG TPA: response regulator [Nitrospiraceae bacterium]|nr:response regulator [Nitrospiraceae bacterium]
MHVLILDADPIVLSTLADTVRRRLSGAEVNTAASLHAGLKKLAHTDYAAIVSDARLPDAPGVAAISVLRQRYPDTPIILMSAELGQDLMAYATLSGVYLFLHKPIEHNVLIAMLNRVIEQRRLGRQTHQLTIKANRHTKRARKAIAYARLLLEAKEHLLSRRQEALVESEKRRHRLANIVDGIRHGIMVFDRSWRIVWLNEAVPQVFSRNPRDEWLGKEIWEACSELTGSRFEQECRRAVGDRLAVQFKARFPAEECWYDIKAVPDDDGLSVFIEKTAAGQPPLSKLANDSEGGSLPETGTVRQRADYTQEESTQDETLPRLSEQIQRARETERGRIARELHHDLDHLLATFKSDLEWLDGRLPQEPLPVLLKVRFMTHLVDRMSDTVRRICSELRPAILDDLGLAAAIQWQASTFEHRTGLRCIVSVKDVDRTGGQDSAELFRIFQELLTHVAHHAGTTVVWVTLKKEGAWLILEVNDNGCGLTDGDTDPTIRRFLSLKERVLLLGGQLSIDYSSGQGVAVMITIPTSSNHQFL